MAKPSRYDEKDIERYFQSGQWNRITMSQIWDNNAVRFPDRQAIVDPFKALTWGQAKSFTDRAAVGFVALGLERDDVVVLQLPNSVELHLLRVACEKAGVICLPVPTNMREHEIGYIMEHTGAKAVIVPDEFRGFDFHAMIRGIRPHLPELRHTVVVGDKAGSPSLSLDDILAGTSETLFGRLEERRYGPEEVSIVFLTSGSTGLPKFVEYPAATCSKTGEHFVRLMKMNESDVVAAIAPASRGPNLVVYSAAPIAAAKIVMCPWSGGKEALDLIEREGVTVAGLVPTQLAKMLEDYKAQNRSKTSVRVWISAGSVLPATLVEAVETNMGGVTTNLYGAVDFGVMTITVPEDDLDVRLNTVGKPRFDTSVRIVDDGGKEVSAGEAGEITGMGPCCASGYYRDLKATRAAWKENGSYATGDIGRIDARGNVVVVGRKKDIIIRGGQNIIPSEIESLLMGHPRVREVAIVAMPDDIMGEKACAYIVLRGIGGISIGEITSFLHQHNIATYKLPERIEVVDRLPMVSDGQKIDKKALAQEIAQKLITERNKR